MIVGAGAACLGAVAGLENAAVYRFCLLVSAMVVALSGCSVGMALSGDENPDLGAIKVGSTRGEVEMHLGSPVRSSSGENGTRTDIYEYEIGNEPSAGRAVAHGFADVLTLGLWEIAGTPMHPQREMESAWFPARGIR